MSTRLDRRPVFERGDGEVPYDVSRLMLSL
jgi:hypothetical protein